MAKDKERQLARLLYVEQLKSAKEIARQTRVQEKTIGAWIKEGGWKEERDARRNSRENLESNLRDVISALTQERVNMERDKNTDPREKIRIADEISKWSKTLESVKKERSIHLSVYIEVMESIFNALRAEHPEIYMKTLDFQEKHVNLISKKLG